MPDILQIRLDHMQRRLALNGRSNRAALLGSELYDDHFTGSDNLFLLPGANCLCLKPYQMDADYDKSNAAPYTKYTIGGGYEVNTSAKWFLHEDFPGAGGFYNCDDSVGEYIRTSAAVGFNRPICLSTHGFAAGDVHPVLDFGYSSSTTDPEAAEIGFKLWRNGTLELYKNGTWIKDLKGLVLDPNFLNRLFIFPCKRRELVFFSVGQTTNKEITFGNVARHVFDDIDETEAEPVITPDAKFFVRAGDDAGGSVKVQFQPCTFTTGTALTTTFGFPRPPAADAELYDQWPATAVYSGGQFMVHGDLDFGGAAHASTTRVVLADLRKTDNSGAFTPDGVSYQCKGRIRLTTTGTHTPFIYGFAAEYAPKTTFTNGAAEFDATPFYTSCDIQVPDEPFGARSNIELIVGLEEIERTGEGTEEDPYVYTDIVRLITDEVPGIERQQRPIALSLGYQEAFFDGIALNPRFTDGIIDQVKRIAFECQTVFRMLEKYIFESRLPFDGMQLADAITMVLQETGIFDTLSGDRIRISDLDYTIGTIPADGCDEWNLAAEIGETALQVLEKLARLAADCVWGEHPGPDGPEFWFLTPEDLEAQEPVITLYREKADALAANPTLTDDEASELTYAEWHEETLAIEANEARATGIDPRTGNIIQSYGIDESSADPELAPAARPDNWVGYPLLVGASARSFRSQDDTDRCATGLLAVASGQQIVGEFVANTILLYQKDDVWLPVWRMDRVDLDGIGERNISSWSGSFVKEVSGSEMVDDFYHRRARYTTGAILGKGGNTAAQIQGASRMREFEQLVIDLRKAPLERTGIIAVNKV